MLLARAAASAAEVCAAVRMFGVRSCAAMAGACSALCVAALTLPAGSIATNRSATLEPELARDILLAVLDNTGVAMLETGAEGFRQALLPFVDP